MINLQDHYSEDELKTTLIKLIASSIGLTREDWSFIRGAKTVRNYLDPENNLIIQPVYTYSYSQGNRKILDFSERVDFYDVTGNIYLSIPVPNKVGSEKLKDINRIIRQRQMDHLETRGEGLRDKALLVSDPLKSQLLFVADSLDTLFTHYNSEITEYLSRGTLAFENSVLNETDPNILNILSIPAQQPTEQFPNGLTVRESILYQLTGIIP